MPKCIDGRDLEIETKSNLKGETTMENYVKVEYVEQMLKGIISSTEKFCEQVDAGKISKFLMNIVQDAIGAALDLLKEMPMVNLEADELREILYKRFEEEK